MKTLSFFLLIIISIGSYSQPPDNYYSSAEGVYGQDLLNALNQIIDEHTTIGYSGLWVAFSYTDARDDGTVWDMYSNCTFTFGEDQDTGSGGTTECDVYNREHSFPASWFGNNSSSPMYSDLFHLYPTDKKVNSIRANYPFGEVDNPSYTSNNGSKLGSCSYPGFTGIVFEPIDEYKGDFARSYFYMATRYNDIIQNWATPITNGTQFPVFDEWVINLLMEWHENDPVSTKEILRNNTIYESYQNNRNPFIDHPEYVARIWGDETSISTEEYLGQIHLYPNPSNNWVKFSANDQVVFNVEILNVIGIRVKTFNSITSNEEMNINDLPNGIYIVRLFNSKYKKAFRVSVFR